MTALHWACKRNLTELIPILLNNRSDASQHDFLQRTPLYYALKSLNFDVVRVEQCNEVTADKQSGPLYEAAEDGVGGGEERQTAVQPAHASPHGASDPNEPAERSGQVQQVRLVPRHVAVQVV